MLVEKERQRSSIINQTGDLKPDERLPKTWAECCKITNAKEIIDVEIFQQKEVPIKGK